MWYPSRMEQEYTIRAEREARLRDAALLRKVAHYRNGASQDTKTVLSEFAKQQKLNDTPERTKLFVRLMSITVAILWANSFFFPILSILTILILTPIFKNTRETDNWRYGALFISGIAALFTFASIIKAASPF